MENYGYEGKRGGLDAGCGHGGGEDCGKGKKDNFCKLITENKKLAGVKFELRAKCGCLIACAKTNECGEIIFNELPFGAYFLIEAESGKGWQCDSKPICVEINEENPHKCVEVFNKRNIGSIKLIKFGKEEKFVCEKGKDCDDEDDN